MSMYRKNLTYRNSGQYRLKGIAPFGLDSSAFGTAALSRTVIPAGTFVQAFGQASVYNLRQVVFPAGFAAGTVFGTTYIGNFIQRLRNVGALDAGTFGTALFAAGIRYIDEAGRGPLTASYGTARVEFLVRQIYPNWFVAGGVGSPAVDRHHQVFPGGWDSSAFGQSEVHVPRQYVDLAGLAIPAPGFGTPRVSNWVQHAAPAGFLPAPTLPEQFGTGYVYNLKQIVYQLHEVTPDDEGVFGDPIYMTVLNRNRQIITHGADWAPQTRFGIANAFNNAVPITTPPFQDMSLVGDTLVAYRIRTVTTEGTDTSQWGSPLNNIVYNAARVLAPPSIASGSLGTPGRVWSNLQTVKPAQFNSALLADPMVAFRIRTIAAYSLPDPPPFGDAHAQLWVRYLQPSGIATGGRGVPFVEQHFNMVNAWGIRPPTNQFGDAFVWNRTPEVAVYGYSMTEWGDADFFNKLNYYAFQGFGGDTFGHEAVVSYRTKVIAPSSRTQTTISTLLEVRNVLSDPPATRTLGIISFAASVMGQPAVRTNVLYEQGADSARYGTPKVVSNGILPISITPPIGGNGTQFGTPTLPTAQYLQPLWPPAPPQEVAQFGTPVMWPHYIWAPAGYPYPGNSANDVRNQIMDSGTFGGDPARPVFGNLVISQKNRTIYPKWAVFDDREVAQFGGARASTNPQYVRQTGMRFQKFGFPELNGGGSTAAVGFDASAIGLLIVSRPPYTGPQTVGPIGFSGTFGAAFISNWIRNLTPLGFVAFRTSTPNGGPTDDVQNQWTWVSLEYDPFQMIGFDSSAFGMTWVSFRVRSISTIGADTSIVADYMPGSFAGRMRVSKSTYVAPTGIVPPGYGQAWLSQGTRLVRPYANPVGRPGQPQMSNINVVAASGWDSETLGDVQRWEAGKIKAYGDDLANLGRAIINRALHAQGFDGEFGQPSVSHSFATEGFDTAGYGVPTAIARWCGNKAMAVQDFDASVFGTAEVAHG